MFTSKIIPIAAFCGLALQFQASTANAQQTMFSAALAADIATQTAGGAALEAQLNAGSATLLSGQSLTPGQSLRSYDGHTLAFQTDGNVVLTTMVGFAYWWTNTYGAPAFSLVMQPDGNLVLYSTDGNTVWASWASNTYSPGAFLCVQGDGNLVIYKFGTQTFTANSAVWASGTAGIQ